MRSDALVSLLNRSGYQAIILPRTGLVPPDLYTYVKPTLRRRGPLSDYVDTSDLIVNSGRLSNIEGQQTGGKRFSAAVDLLKSALEVLGIGSAPKIDLKFTGADSFVFSFANVTYLSVDPTRIDKLLKTFKVPRAIGEEAIEAGALHIAYEYVYSTTLQMRRSDNREFETNISGKVGEFIDADVGAKIDVAHNSVISFSTTDLRPAALAYRAGRLTRSRSRWTFEPEVVMRRSESSAREVAPPDFIAAEAHVLRVVDEPFNSALDRN
jgi:hypothetical protein